MRFSRDNSGPATRRKRRAIAMIYTVVAMTALTAFASLGTDFGRAEIAKTQLQAAVDAAARYASTGLSDNTFLAKAQTAAGENVVDGTALTLTSSDVESGTWNSAANTFTPGGSTTNAIRITGRRTNARGTAVPLTFARMLGVNSVDVVASAVAVYNSSSSNYDVVGLNTINLAGGPTSNA